MYGKGKGCHYPSGKGSGLPYGSDGDGGGESSGERSGKGVLPPRTRRYTNIIVGTWVDSDGDIHEIERVEYVVGQIISTLKVHYRVTMYSCLCC